MKITIETELIANFDPNQPRDNDGKWTDGSPSNANPPTPNSANGVPAQELSVNLGGKSEIDEFDPAVIEQNVVNIEVGKDAYVNGVLVARINASEFEIEGDVFDLTGAVEFIERNGS
jgi:hypothetical protein